MQRGVIHPLLIISATVLIIGVIAAFTFIPMSSRQISQTGNEPPLSLSTTQPYSADPTPTEVKLNNKLEYAKKDGQIYLKYMDKIYIEQKREIYGGYDEPKIITTPPSGLSWTTINISNERPNINSEVFSYRVLPDKERFVVVLRTFGTEVAHEFRPYYFDGKELVKLDLTKPDPIVKINDLSDDGRYVAFNLHECWECDGNIEGVVLMDLQTKQTRMISQTSYFNWKENGSYEYKDKNWYQCESGPLGMCSIDDKDLSLKTGQF